MPQPKAGKQGASSTKPARLKRKPSDGPPSVSRHSINGAGLMFLEEHIDRLFQMEGLPPPCVEQSLLASSLRQLFIGALQWEGLQRSHPAEKDLIKFRADVAHKAEELLEVLGYRRGLKEMNDFQSVVLHDWVSHLSLGVSLYLPQWLDTWAGLRRWHAPRSDGSPLPALDDLTPQVMQLTRDALEAVPIHLAVLLQVANEATRLHSLFREAHPAGPSARGRRADHFQLALFRGLAAIHREAFGCEPRIQTGNLRLREGPSIGWARGIIRHASENARGYDAADVEVLQRAARWSDRTIADKLAKGAAHKPNLHGPAALYRPAADL